MPYAGSFTITQKPSAKDGASDLYALNSQFAVHFVHEELLNAAYTAKEEPYGLVIHLQRRGG